MSSINDRLHFPPKLELKQPKKSFRCPGFAILLEAQCHHQLFISRPDTNARKKEKSSEEKSLLLLRSLLQLLYSTDLIGHYRRTSEP